MADDGIITRDNVSRKIEEAISSWATNDAQPPHSMEQIVVMALLASEQKLSRPQILAWICDHYKYYRRAVVSGFCKLKREDDSKPTTILNDISKVLDSVDLPAKKVIETVAHYPVPYWSVELRDSLSMVIHLLREQNLESSKIPGFFRLPGELRNTIYDMVFGYSNKSGLIVDPCKTSLSVADKESKRPFDLCCLPLRGCQYPRLYTTRRTRSCDAILAPLLTNRQFYKEAVSTFCRINHFHFEDLVDLYNFLVLIASKRRKHLRSITSTYWSTDASIAPKTFRLLGLCKNLSILNLRIDEKGWVQDKNKTAARRAYRRGVLDPTTKVSSALEMPGLATLRSLRGLQEVNLEGAEEVIMEDLKRDLLRPKTANVGITKKRKSDVEEEKVKTITKKIKKR